MGTLHEAASGYVDLHRDRLIALIQELVRRPSVNHSPQGDEMACQEYIQAVLRQSGYEPDVYQPDEVPELATHPLATPGRRYPGRPNVAAVRKGSGGGRSLILSGHVDTVPPGSLPWTRDAFSAEIEGNRLYGRGSNDMKAGVAINLFVMEALEQLRLELRGDLIFESVVDEEFGGVNGTLAARLRGYVADGAVLTEPSSLRICPGQRGGRTVHLVFAAGGGVLAGPKGSVVDQLSCLLQALPEFAQQRRRHAPSHPLYARSENPVPVTVTKLTTGPWGTREPITVPEECRVELYWQLMPGEENDAADREFVSWFDQLLSSHQTLFQPRPQLSFPIRWLPGSAIDVSSPLCTELSRSAAQLLGRVPEMAGIEGPCDLFLFHQFGIPAVLWGPAGGNTHGSDEYVDLDSVLDAAKVLLSFLCTWCQAVEG